MEKLKLYSYFRSSCAYRVRIALNLKGLPHELIPIHLLKQGGEQHSEQYKKLNPSEQVPALIDDGFLLGQSMAIMEYLEEVFPKPALLPSKAQDRAIVRQICEVINSGIQPLQNLSVSQYLDKNLNVNEEQRNQWMNHWITKGLHSTETLLQKHAGTYSFGDKVTLADCLLIPQVFSSLRFKVNIDQFQKIREINERCMALPEFIKASPEKQPDFE